MTDKKASGIAQLTSEQKIAFIEALLFVSKEPVEPARIMDFLQCRTIGEFERIIEAMEEKYQQEDRGMTLKRSGGGLLLMTKADKHGYLKEFFSIRAHTRLLVPSLETLSIVAYRQPVTLSEISELRGVNSVGPVKNLLQKKLIKITGRKRVPGLPALYATTREFLLYFGLNDMSELPSLEELTEMFEEKEQPSLFNDPV